MTEDFLHYTWKYLLFEQDNLYTTTGEKIIISKPGFHNQDAGPDFFDGRISIDRTQWAGNIEIHINSSDWRKHDHHMDEAYNNVILHVVYIHDEEVFNTHGKKIPVLELKNKIQTEIYFNYKELISTFAPVSCKNKLNEISSALIRSQFDKAMIARLERKIIPIIDLLEKLKGDWEEVAFILFARALGQKTNAQAFEQLACSVSHKFIKKNANDQMKLEAILFGQAGMLHSKLKDEYFLSLKREYNFQKKKNLSFPLTGGEWKYSRMRPSNFPTIRIAQLAAVLHRSPDIFTVLCETENIESFSKKFLISASSYWNDHYRFGEPVGNHKKFMGEQALNGILINAAIPLIFCYGHLRDDEKYRQKALDLLTELKPEFNRYTRLWQSFGIENNNAFDSQAMIEQFDHWCEKKKCLSCSIGSSLIKIKQYEVNT